MVTRRLSNSENRQFRSSECVLAWACCLIQPGELGAFGNPPDAALLNADGLHPTLAGQQAIARRFVERLAGSSRA